MSWLSTLFLLSILLQFVVTSDITGSYTAKNGKRRAFVLREGNKLTVDLSHWKRPTGHGTYHTNTKKGRIRFPDDRTYSIRFDDTRGKITFDNNQAWYKVADITGSYSHGSGSYNQQTFILRHGNNLRVDMSRLHRPMGRGTCHTNGKGGQIRFPDDKKYSFRFSDRTGKIKFANPGGVWVKKLPDVSDISGNYVVVELNFKRPVFILLLRDNKLKVDMSKFRRPTAYGTYDPNTKKGHIRFPDDKKYAIFFDTNSGKIYFDHKPTEYWIKTSTDYGKYKWKGCYQDKAGDRALRYGPHKFGYSMKKCYRTCNRKGYKYFSLQNHRRNKKSWCSCDNSWKHATKHGRGGKKHSCPATHLGSWSRNDIFEIKGYKPKKRRKGRRRKPRRRKSRRRRKRRRRRKVRWGQWKCTKFSRSDRVRKECIRIKSGVSRRKSGKLLTRFYTKMRRRGYRGFTGMGNGFKRGYRMGKKHAMRKLYGYGRRGGRFNGNNNRLDDVNMGVNAGLGYGSLGTLNFPKIHIQKNINMRIPRPPRIQLIGMN